MREKKSKNDICFAFFYSAESLGHEDDVAPLLGDHTHNSAHIVVTRGDYAPLMERVVSNLELAKVSLHELPVRLPVCSGCGGH